ncbi:hypothetical protein DB29_02294 [Shouchella clausii]|nr:hypothetical protein DB29_02294 [Shouchella clausii]
MYHKTPRPFILSAFGEKVAASSPLPSSTQTSEFRRFLAKAASIIKFL